MKRFMLCLFIAVFGVLVLCAGSVMATGFTTKAIVDPNHNNSWDSIAGTGTALFSFYIVDDSLIGGVEVNSLEIFFDDDIFVGLAASDVTVTNPVSGWSDTLASGSGGFVYSLSSTTSAPVTTSNHPLMVTVDYTLSNVAAYNNASGAGWSWHEGSPWGLGYTMSQTIDLTYLQIQNVGIVSVHTSGGSTSPVPEPGTIALLGIGLAGLAGVSIRKKMKTKKNVS